MNKIFFATLTLFISLASWGQDKYLFELKEKVLTEDIEYASSGEFMANLELKLGETNNKLYFDEIYQKEYGNNLGLAMFGFFSGPTTLNLKKGTKLKSAKVRLDTTGIKDTNKIELINLVFEKYGPSGEYAVYPIKGKLSHCTEITVGCKRFITIQDKQYPYEGLSTKIKDQLELAEKVQNSSVKLEGFLHNGVFQISAVNGLEVESPNVAINDVERSNEPKDVVEKKKTDANAKAIQE